jgi:hypothetical protein
MHQAECHLHPSEIERRLLAALCSPLVNDETRARILGCLATHKFATPDYETMVRALNQMPRASAGHIRETLGARVTRLGFPDIDVESILATEPPSAEEIERLLRQLKR